MTRRTGRTRKGKLMATDLPISIAQRRPKLPLFGGSPCNVAGMKAQQRIKIQEIRSALKRTGFLTLDEQAKVLGLPRSTAWSVLKPNHKSFRALSRDGQSHAKVARASCARPPKNIRIRQG